MNPLPALAHVVNKSGKTRYGISLELGYDKNALSSLFSSGFAPRFDKYVRIAEASGYKTFLVCDGERGALNDLEGDPYTGMSLYGVIGDLCKRRGMTVGGLCNSIGRNRTYIASAKSRGSVLTTNTVLMVLDALGCRLVLSDGTEDIEVDNV